MYIGIFVYTTVYTDIPRRRLRTGELVARALRQADEGVLHCMAV